MKLKAISEPKQIQSIIKLMLNANGIEADPLFENDTLVGLELIEPNTGTRIKLKDGDRYSNGLDILIEEPENVIPNGFRLHGRYKDKIDINEFYDSEEKLKERLDGLSESHGYHYFNNPDSLKERLNLEFHPTAVIPNGQSFEPTKKPLLEYLKNNDDVMELIEDEIF